VPESALRRELREELDIGVRQASLIGFVSERYGPGGFPVLVAAYRVRPASGRMRAQDDISEVRWFALDRIPYHRVAFPAVRRLLRRYLRGRGARGRGA
jgi:ADP-ribose pyrophosphatase YjhB (NUDIX family)